MQTNLINGWIEFIILGRFGEGYLGISAGRSRGQDTASRSSINSMNGKKTNFVIYYSFSLGPNLRMSMIVVGSTRQTALRRRGELSLFSLQMKDSLAKEMSEKSLLDNHRETGRHHDVIIIVIWRFNDHQQTSSFLLHHPSPPRTAASSFLLWCQPLASLILPSPRLPLERLWWWRWGS